MKHHIIAQVLWAAVLYAGIAFALGGWWSPFDWGSDWGVMARGLLLVSWLWLGVLAALIAEDWRNA